MATKEGTTWYSGDGEAEYAVRGDTIVRGDGSYAAIDPSDDADAIAEALANGDRKDSEFDWIDE